MAFTLPTFLSHYNLYLFVCDMFAVTTADVGTHFGIGKGTALRHLRQLSNDMNGHIADSMCEDDDYGPQDAGNRKPGKHLIWQCWEDSQSAYYTDTNEWLQIRSDEYTKLYTGAQPHNCKEADMARTTKTSSSTTRKARTTKKAAAPAKAKKATAKKAAAPVEKRVPVSKFVMALVVAQQLSDEAIYTQVQAQYPDNDPGPRVAGIYRNLLNNGLRNNPATGETIDGLVRIGGPAPKAEKKATAKKAAAPKAAAPAKAKSTRKVKRLRKGSGKASK